MKRQRESDIVAREEATSPPSYWLPRELFSMVLLHAIQYSMLDEEQYKRLVRYRRVCKAWAYDIVNAALLTQVRHWDHQMMRSILFWTEEESSFNVINSPIYDAHNIPDTAARLFAGCQSLSVRHHHVPRWLQEAVPKLSLLHSIWFEVCHGEWPVGWTKGCHALKRLVLNGTMWIKTDQVDLTSPLPINLETLWILAWPQCQIDKLGTEKMAALKYYTGPHLRDQFTVVPLHYTHYMPKTVKSHPRIMHDFIMRGKNCSHCQCSQ